VLTGAGISAESGVPTFRGKEGLWGKFSPEELATMSAFVSNPKLVWEWYTWRRKVIEEVKPNPGHYALRDLEQWFERFTLVTQNVDGLHRAAGSENILELHGNIYRNKCSDCNRQFPADMAIDPDKIPSCRHCGGKIRPDVVWFGEMLDPQVINRAFSVSEGTELFFSIGTSAIVHPAASLPVAAKRRGATLIEVNPEDTPLSDLVDFHVSAKSGDFLPSLVERLRKAVPSP
jgi:NAD-dependent deacetylase